MNSSGNITGANYLVLDNTGKTLGNQTITLLTLKTVSGTPVTQSDLAPIVSFQLNFVDYLNGGNTILSSGEGTLTYTASSSMSVVNTDPPCVDWDYITLETANSSYSQLPTGPSPAFIQYLQKTAAGAVIQKQGKPSSIRHKTSPQPS